MSRKYNNPPIFEALCEFQFIPSQDWDITISGLFYDKIRDVFPDKIQQTAVDFNIQPGQEGKFEQKVSLSQRMQFFRSDKTALIQLGTDILTINHLKPYPSWDVFKPLIFDTLNTYRGISNPKGIERIGLRYINLFEFDKGSVELKDYFNYFPSIPPELPQDLEAFIHHIEIPHNEGGNNLILVLKRIISKNPKLISLLLELNFFMIIPNSISFEQVSEWLENAHNQVEKAFEACITDKSRSLFMEE